MSLILVVDDDPATREVLASVMREDGHQVVSSDAAEKALELLAQLPVGLVLLDLGLPGMHGEQFLEQRSARGLQSKAPVVVITAAGNAETASRVRGLGASLTVTKPFNADELVTIGQVRRLALPTSRRPAAATRTAPPYRAFGKGLPAPASRRRSSLRVLCRLGCLAGAARGLAAARVRFGAIGLLGGARARGRRRGSRPGGPLGP